MSYGGSSFMVDLGALQDAIGGVSSQRDVINEGLAQMRTDFANIENDWQGPAAGSFTTLTATFNTAADQLTSVLEEAISKMQAAHDNYASTEQTNTGNYTVTMANLGPGNQGSGNQGNGNQGNQGNPDQGSGAQQAPGTQPLLEPTAQQTPATLLDARVPSAG